MSYREARYNQLVSDTDQDEAACRQWIRDSDEAAIQAVWNCIQRHYDDPAMEIMSRFAQLGISLMAIKDAQ